MSGTKGEPKSMSLAKASKQKITYLMPKIQAERQEPVPKPRVCSRKKQDTWRTLENAERRQSQERSLCQGRKGAGLLQCTGEVKEDIEASVQFWQGYIFVVKWGR